MRSCAHRVLDTADIVRDGDFSATMGYPLQMAPVRVAFLSFLFLPLLRGCGSEDTHQTPAIQLKPEDVHGCYEIALSEWKPDLRLGEDAKFITPPSRISLSMERGSRGFEAEGYLLRPAPGGQPSIHRSSFWKIDGTDTITLVWTTGFSGLEMKLHLEGDTLKGQAGTFWDFPRTRQKAEVVARRIGCVDK